MYILNIHGATTNKCWRTVRTKQLAKYLYEFRTKHGIHGDQEHDWYSALHFIDSWKGEIERRRFWEKMGYEIDEVNKRRRKGTRRRMSDKELFYCWLTQILYGWNEQPKEDSWLKKVARNLKAVGLKYLRRKRKLKNCIKPGREVGCGGDNEKTDV